MREVSNSSFRSCGKLFSEPFYWFPLLPTAAECVHHVLLCIVGEPLTLLPRCHPTSTPHPRFQPGSLYLAYSTEMGSVPCACAHASHMHALIPAVRWSVQAAVEPLNAFRTGLAERWRGASSGTRNSAWTCAELKVEQDEMRECVCVCV